MQKTYVHGPYHAFKINDPKPRHIHKATVRDRLVHHALYRLLSLYFDRKFIFDSHSSRRHKGIHRALNRFRSFAHRVSRNHTKTCWVLKGDIRQFFASINHDILKNILATFITDRDILWLLAHIIDSFETERKPGSGLPLGNVTSQLLVNVYLNEFDRFVKRGMGVHYYIRFADDFVILSENKAWLKGLIPHMEKFLRDELHLKLHPDKLFLRTVASGVDFLGWVHFPHHRVLRTVTKRRAWKRLRRHPEPATLQSYRGLLQHGNAHKIAAEMQKFFDNVNQRAQVPKTQSVKKD